MNKNTSSLKICSFLTIVTTHVSIFVISASSKSTCRDADDDKQCKETLPHDAYPRWDGHKLTVKHLMIDWDQRLSLCLCGSKPLYKKDLIICAHSQLGWDNGHDNLGGCDTC